MKRKLAPIILILLIFTNSLGVYANADLKVDAKAAILMEVNTGEIIYKLNEHERLAPASITKIMTMLLGVEALNSGRISLNDKVIISNHASRMGGSQVYLEAGETQTVEDLFRAIAIRSANDASVALAEHIAGSEEIFVKMMNEKAKELGMENTHFANASGLPNENHYVSAYDVAIMSKELLKYPIVNEWLTTYMYDLKVGRNKNSIQTMVNTNRLVKEYEGTTGIKTGSTNEAGFCISASAKRGDLELIAVVLGSKTSQIRFDEAKRMLDYGFANFESINIGKKGDIVATLPVEKGKLYEVDIMLERDSFVLLPKGESGNIEKDVVLPDIIKSPMSAGDVVGELIIRLNGKEIDRVNLVIKSEVEKANLLNILNRTIKSYLKGR
ncbi:MAG: D-alanyl-D-alanine carboxypeptidase [Tissierellia bacterium]|nr:D-alanyl-D-alanine carboxypeptidase [Tissierellia bacterium]